MGRKLTLISIVSSAPATALVLGLIFGFYSPIGTGDISNLQAASLMILFLSIVPTAAVLYFYNRGVVDIEVSQRKLRTPLYAIGIGSQILATIVFYIVNSKIMFVTSVAFLSATILLLLINFRWKISAHASGIAGPVTALFMVFGPNVLPLYLLLLPVFLQRLKLNVHTLGQLVGGTIVSVIVAYIVYGILY